MNVGILFPHQLFEQNPIVKKCEIIYLIEEQLFFKQYNFHKQKITFHRASMKFYEKHLQSESIEVRYIDSFDDLSDIRKLIPHLKSIGIESFHYLDTTDYWLEERITLTSVKHEMIANKSNSPLFLNTSAEITTYFSDKKRLFQTDFYKHQRKEKNILLEENQKPIGGKWTYDDENRLKYPKGKIPPKVNSLPTNSFYEAALKYTNTYYPTNYGEVSSKSLYPTTFEESKEWLNEFLKTRLLEFGAYEDAIVRDENILHHSILTPMLNVGLLTPDYIIEQTLSYASNHEIPLNSLEGFIRQILGWREFIRAVYQLKGREERTKNHWCFTRKIPPSFWTGTTGIEPIDSTVKKVLETGYCHHIERLMVIGNFMLLCEFDPNEVYKWFMELFIDAYDWVMVPNVYGMSQFADGGLMATKPYISGSNYLMKMSDYKKGSWQPIWDGLFWRFMHTQRDFFLQNPRLGMLVRTFDKMSEEKKQAHLSISAQYLDNLSCVKT
jgi:deoxyribodipyrimidine photolyase-related protein